MVRLVPKTFTAALADGTAFVNGEDVSVLGGTLQFDCPATDVSLAGKYPIMPYGYTSNNYEIYYKADSLQVNAVAPKAEITAVTVKWSRRSGFYICCWPYLVQWWYTD